MIQLIVYYKKRDLTINFVTEKKKRLRDKYGIMMK